MSFWVIAVLIILNIIVSIVIDIYDSVHEEVEDFFKKSHNAQELMKIMKTKSNMLIYVDNVHQKVMLEIEEREFRTALEESKRSLRDSADVGDSYNFAGNYVSVANTIFSNILDARSPQGRTSSRINDDDVIIEE